MYLAYFSASCWKFPFSLHLLKTKEKVKYFFGYKKILYIDWILRNDDDGCWLHSDLLQELRISTGLTVLRVFDVRVWAQKLLTQNIKSQEDWGERQISFLKLI